MQLAVCAAVINISQSLVFKIHIEAFTKHSPSIACFLYLCSCLVVVNSILQICTMKTLYIYIAIQWKFIGGYQTSVSLSCCVIWATSAHLHHKIPIKTEWKGIIEHQLHHLYSSLDVIDIANGVDWRKLIVGSNQKDTSISCLVFRFSFIICRHWASILWEDTLLSV